MSSHSSPRSSHSSEIELTSSPRTSPSASSCLLSTTEENDPGYGPLIEPCGPFQVGGWLFEVMLNYGEHGVDQGYVQHYAYHHGYFNGTAAQVISELSGVGLKRAASLGIALALGDGRSQIDVLAELFTRTAGVDKSDSVQSLLIGVVLLHDHGN